MRSGAIAKAPGSDQVGRPAPHAHEPVTDRHRASASVAAATADGKEGAGHRVAERDGEGLSVRYPTRRSRSLDRVHLRVGPGERVLLAGPSGSGKSTLALAIAGLIPGSVEAELRGGVRVDGVAADSLPPGAAAAQVGIVFQDPASQLTMAIVEDEVAFGLENLGWPAAEMPAAVMAALRTVGLADRPTWPVDRLSGGQQQRVVLAATVVMDPAILVLDEPGAHMDPRAADELYGWIRELSGGRRRTVLAVEHELDRVVSGQVDRCVVLDGTGRVALDGPIAEILGTRAAAIRCRELGVWLPAGVRLALLLGDETELPLDTGAAGAWLAADPCRLEVVRAAAAGVSGSEWPAEGPPVLVARGLTIAYGSPGREHVALRDADLEVRAGELVALVGANGSGKSTLLRAVCGLLPVSRGTVDVGGVDLLRRGPHPELVGHVFQNPEAGIIGNTVFDDVAHGPRSLGWDEERIEDVVRTLLRRFGLEGLARANPFTLSQGQKRRLSVVAATIVRPQLLVLDEPTFGQDARSAAALVEEIAAVRRDGTAVLVATHDLELVAEVADRVVGIADGEILAALPPAAFLADDRLLDRTAQVQPPLGRLLAHARTLGADVPAFVRWADLERTVEVRRATDGARGRGTQPARPTPTALGRA